MSLNDLWVEKYRPKTVSEYVFKDDQIKARVNEWVSKRSIPHILLSGGPGIGKTTLAKVLINEIDILDSDLLELNASRERGIDEIRVRITNFVSTMPFGELKVVLLDEADYLTPDAQAALRGVMESYASTARFILTCNYPNKIIPALHSRCQQIHIDKLDHTEFTSRVATVLLEENVEFELDDLDTYIKASYPDLRKCLNLVQANSRDGKLFNVKESESSTKDYKVEMVDLFKAGKIRQARALIVSQVRPDEVEELFKWAYDNLDIWSKTDEGKDKAVIIIRNGLVNNTLCSDPEINLSATLCELMQIGE